MIPESFAVIGAVIGSIGGFYYLYETITGKAKPNRVTWLLWWLFPMIGFVAQRAQGVEALSWATFAAGFTPLLIVIASFLNKDAYWKTERRDYVLMAAATVGIVISVVANSPNIAILFALVADALAGVPTLIKAYRRPETESWIAYAISTFGFGLAVLAVPTFTFEHAGFIAYLFGVNLTLALLSSRGRQRAMVTAA
ncbi:MAG TPA: hypothetical protein VM070_08245 [Candidatus Saccharimonadales bacterium]|nr:hypothetical protein [Candidatus Saccharimonadales bacterium]